MIINPSPTRKFLPEKGPISTRKWEEPDSCASCGVPAAFLSCSRTGTLPRRLGGAEQDKPQPGPGGSLLGEGAESWREGEPFPVRNRK